MTFTVCAECHHFWNKGGGTLRENDDISYFCTAKPLPEKRDPVSGRERPYHNRTFVVYKYEFCRDVNRHGKCELWKPKKG